MNNDASPQLKRVQAMFTDVVGINELDKLNMVCPFCGCPNVCYGSVASGEDVRMGYAQGTLVISFAGECDHRWDLILGLHQGKTYLRVYLTGIPNNQMP